MAIIRAQTQPNLIQRARTAWRVFRGIQPRRRKSAPYAFPAWRSGRVHWHLTNFQNYIDEGWTINSLIYSAIMYKIRAMTAAPLRAYVGTTDKPELLDASRPLAQLVARPNKWQSWEEHHALNIAYLNIAGDAFTYIDRKGSKGNVPAALYSMRPDRVLIVPKMENGVATLAGYVYVPEGRTAAAGWTKEDAQRAVTEGKAILLAPENVMHVKLPNPGDPLEGMGYGFSPLTPLARSADVDNEITKFLKMFFERGGIPPFWFAYDEPMDTDEIDEQREKLAEMWGGFENWTQPGILDSGGKIERLGFTFNEMGFEGLDERNETRITMPLGVPGVLIGSRVGLSHATYSNVTELRRMFWEDTMVPETRLFEVELQYFLQGDRGEFVQFDFGNVPALKKNIPDLVKSAVSMIGTGAPPDIAYQLHGLNVPEYPGSDVGHLPWNMVPLLESQPGGNGAQSEEGAASAEDDDRKALGHKQRPKGDAPQLKGRGLLTDEIKDRLGRNFDNIAEQWEGRYEETAAQVFEDERRQVLASLTKAARAAQERKATVNWSEVQTDWVYFYQTEAPEVWRKAFMPLIKGVVEEQGSAWAASFGMQFDVRNLFAEEWYDDYVMEFARGVAETTERDLAAILQQGMAEGSSIPTMRKQVRSLFEQYIEGDLKPEDFEWFTERMPKRRTEMIARTETIRASNRGSNQLYQEWGVESKQWWTHVDGRQCWFCEDMHKTIIPVGDSFWDEGMTQTATRKDDEGVVHSRRLSFNYETVTSPPLHPSCILPGNVVAVPGLVAGIQSFYHGRAFEIRTGAGNVLTVTANHPILTPGGWVAAQFINEGDEIIRNLDAKGVQGHEVAELFKLVAETGEAIYDGPVTPGSFHQDGAGVHNSLIVVADAYSCSDCSSYVQAGHSTVHVFHQGQAEQCDQETSLERPLLTHRAGIRPHLSDKSPSNQPGRRIGQDILPSSGEAFQATYAVGADMMLSQLRVGAQGFLGLPFAGRAPDHLLPFGSERDISQKKRASVLVPILAPVQISSPYVAAHSKHYRAATRRTSPDAFHTQYSLPYPYFTTRYGTSQVASVRSFDYEGNVYDFESESGAYTCNGVIVKNCRCALLPYRPEWEEGGIEAAPPVEPVQGALI